jgi:hypothetical protein
MKALKNAKASGGNRNYFKPGEYLCQIEGVKFDVKRKGGVGYFAAQLKIITSKPDDPGSLAMAVGKTVDFYCGSDNDWYLGNIKQFLEAILGFTQDEFDAMEDKDFAETLEALFGEGQWWAATSCGWSIDPTYGQFSKQWDSFAERRTKRLVQLGGVPLEDIAIADDHPSLPGNHTETIWRTLGWFGAQTEYGRRILGVEEELAAA